MFSSLFHSFFFPSFCIPAFLISADIFSPVTSDTNHIDARVLAAELICFQMDTKHEQSQLINQSLFALRCERPPMERIISAGLLSVELDSNKRGLRKSLSKNRCKGLVAPERLIPVVKRDTLVTNDNKKMSLFENFGTVKQFYTIISCSQTRLSWSFKHTWFPFLSSCVCVPAFIKPNISLPLNHI